MKIVILFEYYVLLHWVYFIHGQDFSSHQRRSLRPLNARDRAIFSRCKGRQYTNKAYGEIPLRWPGNYKSTAPVHGTTDNICLTLLTSQEDEWKSQNLSKACEVAKSSNRLPSTPSKLFVCIGAHVDEDASFMLLMKAVCSVRKFHGASTMIFIFDNGSPHAYYQRMAVLAEYDQRIVLHRAEVSLWEWGALNASLYWLNNTHSWDHFTHFAYLQHSMYLIQPLPLSTLGCPLVSYRTFGPGWLSVGVGMAVTVGEWMVVLDPKIESKICAIWEMVYFTYSVGFVSHMWVAHKLHEIGVFSKIKIDSKGADMLSERLMGAVASWFFSSSPEVCNLDGDFQTPHPQYVGKASHGATSNLNYTGVNESFIHTLCESSAWPALKKIRSAFPKKG